METIAYVVVAAALFWLGSITSPVLGGLIFVIAAAVLAGLKLAGLIAWSWWWIVLPLWAAIGGAYVKMRMAAKSI
jgi:hypothetical protein